MTGIMLLQNLPGTINGNTSNITASIGRPFIDCSAITDFRINEITLHTVQRFGSAEEMPFTMGDPEGRDEGKSRH